ncbi:MAG: methylated-DNA--[protein]-cysteine S-methyltransferase [Negativicutes bacterium]|nr:methylated-DNA--[protein]-cysteine S-methyltransferase [Negativicutes bacterium]MDR3591833.1 methylated-DNA--[protein]-cysteine S-methyltransferase [Negativicutes bacterium]
MNKVYDVLATDWGYAVAVWSPRGLWELTFPRPDAATALAEVTTEAVANSDTTLAEQLLQELKLYYTGYRVEFGVPIDWSGYTPFQAAVLRYTASIHYSEVTTYGQVAAAIGAPRASRAVGGALHINRTPVVVPCHRVLGAAGKLGGFGGGLELKRALLLLEQGVAAV